MRVCSTRNALVAGVLGIALAGCVVAPAPGYRVVAYGAPPPVRYEAVGVAPYPSYFWIGGSYYWSGGRYAWRPGYWAAPRPGYRWVPHTWRRAGGGWRDAGGRWVPRR